ncbi:50S ribosomal protein L10 [Kosmotoga arenicorallina S304]|uniref:Large ribosomal subunit protein uL10 n=1 Tax=Kosmotoga arenicorallina S304 TaxID=1453497 RepID=A0A176JWF1_9BACT|nr:50S ribosomal protein L10 [Kosmotoga arenicorallina]OAA28008.1 50S ribosomal protein L10 [Kosmotoga arenicorallina S304]
MFTRAQKEKFVQELADKLAKSSLILFTDYKGLSVAQISELRGKLFERYEAKAKYQIVKNTLLRLALRKAGYNEEEWADDIHETTAVLMVNEDDPVEAVKIIYDFTKASKNKLPALRGFYLEGKYFDQSKVDDIAQLPSKEQLIAMVVGGIAAPISGLAYALNGVLTKFLYALNAIKDKKSE